MCVCVCVCVQDQGNGDLLDEDSQSILNIIRDTSTSHSLLSSESHDYHMIHCDVILHPAPSGTNSRNEFPAASATGGAAGSTSRVSVAVSVLEVTQFSLSL